jgi:hypothetical protein
MTVGVDCGLFAYKGVKITLLNLCFGQVRSSILCVGSVRGTSGRARGRPQAAQGRWPGHPRLRPSGSPPNGGATRRPSGGLQVGWYGRRSGVRVPGAAAFVTTGL